MSNLDIEVEQERATAIRDSAIALQPVLEARGEMADQLGHLPDETFADLKAAGLTRLTQPRKYGGAELPLGAAVDALAALAGGCGSAAWVCGVYADHDCILGMFPEAVTDEIWGDNPEAVASAGFLPAGKVERRGDGWHVSGQWSWVSGCDHADWFILGALAPGDDGVPAHSFFLVPRSEVTIVDDWQVMGLQSTGSKTITVAGADVPAHRTISFVEVRDGAEARGNTETRPLYRLPHTTTVPFVLVATSLGIAERLLEITSAGLRERATRGQPLAELQSMQLHIAEASANVDCARLLVERDLDLTMSAMSDRRPMTVDERARNKRDQAHVVRLCRRASDRLFDMTGSRAIYDSHLIQRKFRDIRCAGGHIGLSWDVAATIYGRVSFGLDPNHHTF